MSDACQVKPWLVVHSVADHASAGAVELMLAQLPDGAVGRFDAELGVVVVEVNGGADLANQVNDVLGGSGIVSGCLTDDRAVTRYWPERASRPAYWDGLAEDWDICTTCGWSTPNFDKPEDLEAERRRHERDVHGEGVDRGRGG